jgi:hypothetical protein
MPMSAANPTMNGTILFTNCILFSLERRPVSIT